MPELNDHELSKPFQAAEHHAPEHDLTAYIMARVAVTPIHRPAPVKPLIGGKGWLLIAALLALPLVGILITALAECSVQWVPDPFAGPARTRAAACRPWQA